MMGGKEVGTESSDVGCVVGREEMTSCHHMGLHAEAQSLSFHVGNS